MFFARCKSAVHAGLARNGTNVEHCGLLLNKAVRVSDMDEMRAIRGAESPPKLVDDVFDPALAQPRALGDHVELKPRRQQHQALAFLAAERLRRRHELGDSIGKALRDEQQVGRRREQRCPHVLPSPAAHVISRASVAGMQAHRDYYARGKSLLDQIGEQGVLLVPIVSNVEGERRRRPKHPLRQRIYRSAFGDIFGEELFADGAEGVARGAAVERLNRKANMLKGK